MNKLDAPPAGVGAATRDPPARLRRLAARLADAREHGGVVASSGRPIATAEEAFAVQACVARLLSDAPAGWKTGGPADDGLPRLAPLLSRTVLASPATVRPLPGSPLLLEVEFGLRLCSEVSAMDLAACDDGRLLVAEVFVALELCRNRLADPRPPARLFLADGLANAGLVVGGGVAATRNFEFANRGVRLVVNDATVCEIDTDATAEGVPEALLWLARKTRVHGGLRGGDLVITGSLVTPVPLAEGDEAYAEISGVGDARVRIESRC